MNTEGPLYPSSKHYIRFSIFPAATDALALRKALSDALDQTFGITSAAVDIDILWLAQDGKEVVVRVHPEDAPKILAAVVTSTDGPRLSLLQESSVLPALTMKRGVL